MKTLETTLENPATRIAHARGLLEQMAELFSKAGVSVQAYTSPELPVFQKHSHEDQIMLVRELEARVDLFAQAAGEKVDLRDTRQMLWRSLRRGGWTPSSDVFDLIEDEDTVEVYSLDMRQIFRNLECFRWLSYTLEEVHGGKWYELVSRDETVTGQLMAAAQSIVNGEVKSTIDVSHLPNHECVELTSSEKRKFMIQMKAISPVYRDGTLVAFISINKTRSCE